MLLVRAYVAQMNVVIQLGMDQLYRFQNNGLPLIDRLMRRQVVNNSEGF
jgi:hypothetical protein